MIVAAIDFGTTFSGYAYSYRQNPLDIWTHKWNAGTCISQKAPTCILLNPEKQFDSFGYEAEKRFAGLPEEVDDFDQWMFFRRFKMVLHNEEVK